MNRFAPTVSDLAVAAVCATITAAVILPFSFIAFTVFVLLAALRTRTRMRLGYPRLAYANCLASMSLFVGIVAVAAAYRPSKIVEQQLDREVKLPASKLTLAELSYLATFDWGVFPIHTSFSFAEADKDAEVDFRKRELTIRELLDAIETQTVLRHRFAHRGNGYTIRGGGDCGFGLFIREPDLVRERFDVDAYATARDRKAL